MPSTKVKRRIYMDIAIVDHFIMTSSSHLIIKLTRTFLGPSVCLEIFTKEKCVMTKAISIT